MTVDPRAGLPKLMLRYASGLADLTSIRRRRRPWRRTTAPTFAVHCEYPPPPSSFNRKPLSQDEPSAGSFGPSVSEEADDRFGRRRRRPWRRTIIPTPPKATDSAPFSFLFFSIASYEFNNQDSLFS
jgi:hypothetical protein